MEISASLPLFLVGVTEVHKRLSEDLSPLTLYLDGAGLSH